MSRRTVTLGVDDPESIARKVRNPDACCRRFIAAHDAMHAAQAKFGGPSRADFDEGCALWILAEAKTAGYLLCLRRELIVALIDNVPHEVLRRDGGMPVDPHRDYSTDEARFLGWLRLLTEATVFYRTTGPKEFLRKAQALEQWLDEFGPAWRESFASSAAGTLGALFSGCCPGFSMGSCEFVLHTKLSHAWRALYYMMKQERQPAHKAWQHCKRAAEAAVVADGASARGHIDLIWCYGQPEPAPDPLGMAAQARLAMAKADAEGDDLLAAAVARYELAGNITLGVEGPTFTKARIQALASEAREMEKALTRLGMDSVVEDSSQLAQMVKDWLRSKMHAAPAQSFDSETLRLHGHGTEGGGKVGSADRPHRCNHCMDHFASVSACAGCRLQRYCSRECQKAAWKGHKAECRSQQEREKQAKQGKAEKKKAQPPQRHRFGEAADID